VLCSNKNIRDCFSAECSMIGPSASRHMCEILHFYSGRRDLVDTMFQQHGETPHFHKEVMDSLNHKFPEKRTGKGETITWPPLSLDRTHLDFYLVLCMNIPTTKIGALKCVPKHQVAIFSKTILINFQQFVEIRSLSKNCIGTRNRGPIAKCRFCRNRLYRSDGLGPPPPPLIQQPKVVLRAAQDFVLKIMEWRSFVYENIRAISLHSYILGGT
jgi:hypothetical protein